MPAKQAGGNLELLKTPLTPSETQEEVSAMSLLSAWD